MVNTLHLLELGLTPYREAWELQREIFQRVIAGEEEDTLILVEHPPVYTFGRGAEKHDNGALANFLLSDQKLHELGAEKFEIERGGDVTYHGPGQLVGYPILNLGHFKEDLGWYLRALEETIIEVLRTYDVDGFRIAGRTGVWVGAEGREEKICAIGVHASRWCTMHGFAFNVNTDLSYFKHIVPCGISDRGVTSLAAVLGQEVPMEQACERYVTAFELVFDVSLQEPLLTP
ncbi:MAG TPA: lipoyl(octanoyl) transferase LipB [Candidatus Kapabacteria bacterium]|nr:lipoyl(octanoyl) transferase LipB [Candidatus Kapabacteria bacterium]